MMGHTVTQLSLSQGEEKRTGDRPADAEVEAKKQRRRLQNRKNQRARRLRLKEDDAGTIQRSRPFQIKRWRLDESDDCPPKGTSPTPESATTTHISPRLPRTYTGTSSSTAESVTPPAFAFPLSSDHLLHLIQHNVVRAFVSNKRALGPLPHDPTICTINGPCRGDTTLSPVNPNIPPSLVPTPLQQTRYHSIWIDVFPIPRLRDNLIRREGRFDHWELMQDLVGELMSATPASRRRGTSVTVTAPEPRRPLPLSAGSDTDEVTAGCNGLIVWGEPQEMQSWEATPGFLAKWSWAVEGCEELVEISNRWRMKRGAEPITMRLSGSRSCRPPPLSHAATSGGQVLT